MENLVSVQEIIQNSVKPVTDAALQMSATLEQEQQQLYFCLGIGGLVECFIYQFDFSLNHSHCLPVASFHESEYLVETLD